MRCDPGRIETISTCGHLPLDLAKRKKWGPVDLRKASRLPRQLEVGYRNRH